MIIVWQLVQYSKDLGILLIILGLGILVWFCWFSLKRCTKIERDRMIALLVLIAFSVFFWALFEQAGSSITLFTDRNVEMGETFTAGMFQSFNPLFIIFLAPLFAWSWTKLAKMNMEPSAPLKFGLAIFQVGFGFAILVYGSSFAGPDGKVAVIWLALMYLFHTTGELCLSRRRFGDGYSPERKPSGRNDDGSLVFVQFICSLPRRCNSGRHGD